ncbi:MAG: FAD-dependent oxidoreductase [Bacteriovoracaceae bacterium]|nr:FAD-dependent oxidoreductase [Bacteriovoracaceae bacterium]
MMEAGNRGAASSTSSSPSSSQIAIIIGAGPAGLTAAYELLQQTPQIRPIILEQADFVGGIARTYDYQGYKLDMGGHRFYSAEEKWMQWWQKILPLEDGQAIVPEKTDELFLVRPRLSHILYQRKLCTDPVTLSLDTILKLGVIKLFKCGLSYLRARCFPRKEKSLADFMINRFGLTLYQTFFRDYTQKVWGVPCEQLPPDWGGQRIKGISLLAVARAACKTLGQELSKQIKKSLKRFTRRSSSSSSSTWHSNLGQGGKEISFIDRFIYPKYGPGQLWEKVAHLIQERGGEIHLGEKVQRIFTRNSRIVGVKTTRDFYRADWVFSSMPLKDLMGSLEVTPTENYLPAYHVAAGLVYRDFRTVGLSVKQLNDPKRRHVLQQHDTWIYVQEKDVLLGRIQIFNNWSPYLVPPGETDLWLGLEYFCNEGDFIWTMSEAAMIEFAGQELVKLGLVKQEDLKGGCSLRVAKAYPSYIGTYPQIKVLRDYLAQFTNLFLIGRNGTHQYNNMDQSMADGEKAVYQLKQRLATASDTALKHRPFPRHQPSDASSVAESETLSP